MPSDFVKATNYQIPDFTEEKEGKWNGPYFFILASDPQPGLVDLVDGGDGSKWEVEIQRTEKAVAAINQMQPRPRFVIVCGDIVDAFPGTKHRTQQIVDLKQAFSSLHSSIPLLAVSGNHDLGNNPTPESINDYRQEFGDDFYSFYVGGVFYIVINSQCIFEPSQTKEITDLQNKWLEAQLQNARNNSYVHVVLFMHIPLFLNTADDEDSYFVIHHKQRMSMLKKFAAAGIEKVFSGHYHRNAGGVWSGTANEGKPSTIEVVVTSAIGAQLGDDKAGVRIVKVTKQAVTHKYYPLDNFPKEIELN